MAKPGNKPFSTRLPEDVRASLQARAQAIGVTESDLGRMFIIEKLAEAKADPRSVEARSLAALTIAALSETIDLDQAEELVRQHLAQKAPVSQ